MKDLKRTIMVGGLVLASMAVAGYRTYQLNKLRTEPKEEIVIDIEPNATKEIKH